MSRILDPHLIEGRSFSIISQLLPDVKIPFGQKEVLKRVIHATTELGYAKDLFFHPQAIKAGLAAIKQGKDVICDVSMVQVGVNQNSLASFGGKVRCFINHKDVIKRSNQEKIARAIVAMQKAATYMDGAIVAIGNAPTALFTLCDLVRSGKVKPGLIIGVPVGFVGAEESKKLLRGLKIPHITNRSRKGGSSVAAAITNALLKLAQGEKK